MSQSAPALEETYYKGYDPKVIGRLIGFARPYRLQLLASLVLMLIGSGASVASPYLVKIALDSGLRGGDVAVLQRTVMLYLGAALAQWASTFVRVNIMARTGQGIIYDLRARLFEHLQALSLSFFSHYSVGRVITRVINDVGVLRQFITWAVLATARDLFTLLGIVVAMLAMNVRLSLITFTVLPLMAIATALFQKRARENYRRVRSAISWVNSVLAENINGVRVVQAFSREGINYQHFRDDVNQNHLDSYLTAARTTSAFPAVVEILGSLAIALVVWLGGAAVLGENITPGILVAFVLYIDRFFVPIRDLSRRYDTFQSTMAGGERIFNLLETPVEVEDPPQAVDLPPIQGEVHFDGVSFHYLDDPTPVLEDIDLHVKPGETVALVGETGAGKTTLVKLLSRFHDPTSGRLLVDGYDLRHVTQKSLRRQLGIVLQEPFLFNGSVCDNIQFGHLEASQKDIEDAARIVGAHQFISEMRYGYNTAVEEGGALLSVGQRQLISFARALLANPRILIMDEATSSVDTQTEIAIQKALAHLLHGRTAFVIAHRLSTVVNADVIVVIHDGRIVEKGTHSQLLAMGGYYHRLYRMGFGE
jgi:ATP-binding cassette subfamily B multidrug efflux pump